MRIEVSSLEVVLSMEVSGTLVVETLLVGVFVYVVLSTIVVLVVVLVISIERKTTRANYIHSDYICMYCIVPTYKYVVLHVDVLVHVEGNDM